MDKETFKFNLNENIINSQENSYINDIFDESLYRKKTEEKIHNNIGRIILDEYFNDVVNEEKILINECIDGRISYADKFSKEMSFEESLAESDLKAKKLEEDSRILNELIAEERRRREEEMARERARQEAEARRLREEEMARERARQEADPGIRRFDYQKEARIRELAGLYPGLAESFFRGVYSTVLDSRIEDIHDRVVFKELARRYHPDSIDEDEREKYKDAMSAINSIYSHKDKKFWLH